ncbi:MAG TPA: hypothetical protein VIF62_31000 [Labilithrix sp.]
MRGIRIGAFVLLAEASLVGACKKTDEVVPPGGAYGCVNLVQGRELGCAEVEAAATNEEHTRFVAACTNAQLKNLRGRLVRHCSSDDVAAECVVSAEKVTIRYYKRELTAGAQQGATLGCKVRGGTYSER